LAIKMDQIIQTNSSNKKRLLVIDYIWNENEKLRELLEEYICCCQMNVSPSMTYHELKFHDTWAIKFRCTDIIEVPEKIFLEVSTICRNDTTKQFLDH